MFLFHIKQRNPDKCAVTYSSVMSVVIEMATIADFLWNCPRGARFKKAIQCKNLVSVYKTFKNLLLQKLLNKVLKYYIQIVLGYVLSKFVQIELHINRPWVCAIEVCSNGGITYII